ncbi:MAG: ATP-binding protein, partial [Candidatus Eremiobacteraeota bacterium]|nr:ATP-binding protein [Candidatus Eremiobacteraeota bacterium]
MSTDVVELRIPSRAEWVALARLAVAAVANRLRFTIEDIEDVKLAVAEACTAVIQHERHGEYIDLTCETSGDSLRVRVRDAGREARVRDEGRSMDLD